MAPFEGSSYLHEMGSWAVGVQDRFKQHTKFTEPSLEEVLIKYAIEKALAAKKRSCHSPAQTRSNSFTSLKKIQHNTAEETNRGRNENASVKSTRSNRI